MRSLRARLTALTAAAMASVAALVVVAESVRECIAVEAEIGARLRARVALAAALLDQRIDGLSIRINDAGALERIAWTVRPGPLDDTIADRMASGGNAIVTVFARAPDGVFRAAATTLRTPEGERDSGAVLDPAGPDHAALIAGQPMRDATRLSGVAYRTLLQPVFGPDGQVDGAIHLGLRAADTTTIVLRVAAVGAATAFLAIAAVAPLAWWLAGGMLSGLGAVRADLARLTRGDLSRPIGGLDRQDEVAEAARGLESLRRVLRAAQASRDAAAAEREALLASLEMRVRDATAEAEASRDAAEAANRAKTRFLAAMSHEIRNPMNGVIGMADLLAQTDLDPHRAEIVSAIRASAGLLLAVINDVLDVSKIEAGKMTFASLRFSLADCAERVCSIHRATAQKKGLALQVMTQGEAVWRRGDPNRIEAILHNLVGNALKFTGAGGVTIEADATAPGTVHLSVIDTGRGMTRAQARAAFRPFEQVGANLADRDGGTGLGLAIVKTLTEAMGGTVSVNSIPGKGSTFRISLPLPVDAAGETAPAAPPEKHAAPDLNGLRVLVVDDSEINRFVMQGLLGTMGVSVTLAPGGAEALAILAERDDFGLVFLDIVMPGMSGEETLLALPKLEARLGRRPLPAVACTANALEEQVRRMVAAGFDGHLSKPVRADSLSAAMTRVLAPAAVQSAAVA